MPKTSPIRAGLLRSSSLQPLVRDGLRAMDRAHLNYLELSVRRELQDSLEIDENLKSGREQQNRWDYLLGHGESLSIVAFEPHSANNHEIEVVIRKRARALKHLEGHLRPGVTVRDWFWVASGSVDFAPFDKADLRLKNHGISFVGRRLLSKRLKDLAATALRTRR